MGDGATSDERRTSKGMTVQFFRPKRFFVQFVQSVPDRSATKKANTETKKTFQRAVWAESVHTAERRDDGTTGRPKDEDEDEVGREPVRG
jgi:hypothetical protein